MGGGGNLLLLLCKHFPGSTSYVHPTAMDLPQPTNELNIFVVFVMKSTVLVDQLLQRLYRHGGIKHGQHYPHGELMAFLQYHNSERATLISYFRASFNIVPWVPDSESARENLVPRVLTL